MALACIDTENTISACGPLWREVFLQWNGQGCSGLFHRTQQLQQQILLYVEEFVIIRRSHIGLDGDIQRIRPHADEAYRHLAGFHLGMTGKNFAKRRQDL